MCCLTWTNIPDSLLAQLHVCRLLLLSNILVCGTTVWSVKQDKRFFYQAFPMKSNHVIGEKFSRLCWYTCKCHGPFTTCFPEKRVEASCVPNYKRKGGIIRIHVCSSDMNSWTMIQKSKIWLGKARYENLCTILLGVFSIQVPQPAYCVPGDSYSVDNCRKSASVYRCTLRAGFDGANEVRDA